jgi:transcriptional regulator with GAF, ATPase, and Fis domain
MKLPLSIPIPWRQALLFGAGILACVYAGIVLCFVPLTPDIGFRCAFTPVVKQVFPSNEQTFPRVGDTIVQVGSYSWSSSPTETKLWAQIQLLRELNLREQPLEKQTARAVLETDGQGNRTLLSPKGEKLVIESQAGEKRVLVKFRAHDGDEPQTVWLPLRRFPLSELLPSILWCTLKLGLFSIGALVFWKRPTDPSAAQFFLLCIVTLVAFMGGYHWARIATEPGLLLPFMVCIALLPAVSLEFYLVFPRPKGFILRHPWWTSLANYAIPTGFLTALILSYLHLRSVRDGSQDELADAWEALAGKAAVYLKLAGLWYLASVVSLVHSFRTAADATERNQVKWILYGSLVALVPIGYTLHMVLWDLDNFGSGSGTWPMFAASVCFTIAFAVSITRYRLMQLDKIVSSGMAYFVISFLAGLVYYAVVFVGMLVSVFKGPSLGEALSVSTTALVLLLVLDLVRSRVKKVLDRRFHREKHQLDRTLQRMSQAIEQLVDPPTLARRLLQTSAELLGVSQGAVYLREGEPPIYRLAGCLGPTPPPLAELSSGCPLVEVLQTRKALVGRIGNPSYDDPAQRQLRFLGGEIACALVHEERLLAFLVLGGRDLGWYGPADLNLLAAFAQFTALALESAKGHRTIELLSRDLQTKVEKISEQQRRILALQSQLDSGIRSQESEVRGQESGVRSQESAGGDSSRTSDLFPLTSDSGIIGTSACMRRLLDMVRKASASPSAVLICGESGTGKELLARALHENSPRSGKPYVKVHCAALTPTLLESELFGHVKGAFTSAHRDKIGRFEMANGGTLFLDEIGDISLEVQTKLLRVLQEKTFERVGSSEPIEVDVRVVAATHQDLEELIRRERFRKDLYFRLKVIPITVPPLRDRIEDIPELALHFLRLYSQRCGKSVTQIEDEAMAALKSYDWPGNVRELENVIERAVVVAEGASVTAAELPPELALDDVLLDAGRHGEKLPGSPDDAWPNGDDQSLSLTASGDLRFDREAYGQRERERLVRALAAAGGNKAEAARALGMARSTLLSRLKKYGLS